MLKELNKMSKGETIKILNKDKIQVDSSKN
jgi:TusA-related sulfurtransferase